MRTDASLLETNGATSEYREVNGVRLHVVTAGDEDAPLVILLHGFPEFFYEWRRQIGPLVEAGYRVLAPDQRGYNYSEKPAGVRPYRLRELSRDVVDLIASDGRDSAHVVGHDWGATVAWNLAIRDPESVDRLGIINAPHPTVLEKTLRSNPRQLRRSWYVFYFQLPSLPEWSLRRNECEALARAMIEGAEPGAFTTPDLERYRAAWRRDGALTAMLNWYRAAARYRDDPARDVVESPTLVVWGEKDFALLPELAPESVGYCVDGRLERLPETSHWVPHEQPERTAELLIDHLDG